MKKEYVFLVFFVLFSILSFYFIFGFDRQVIKISSCGDYESLSAFVGGEAIQLFISDNECKRILGLSGRDILEEGEGMLFVFEETDYNGIWMKDMNFPIDIIWLDEEYSVVKIEENVLPETYPKIFGDDVLSKYVVELNSGFVSRVGLNIGDVVDISY